MLIMVNMWMVRAGENAFLIDDFKDLNIVSIGWEIGDLSGKTSNEIKKIMEHFYPNASKVSIGLNSGQIIRFACDFEIGDYVVTYNPQTRYYLVGKITSDYYYSEKLAKKYNKEKGFYHHFRDVNWIGKTNRDDLTQNSLKPLKSVMTIFNLNDSTKNEILSKMDYDNINWTDFYMEFADKLLEYKGNRSLLIKKIQNVFKKLNMILPTLEYDAEGKSIVPYDIDPFTIFALFNKQISPENRINILNQIKEEFQLRNETPFTFHGISLVNNLKATFYFFTGGRGDNDINNLWELYEMALNFSKANKNEFIDMYNIVSNQQGIKWNITMGLNWIRPFTFINLDTNNRNLLSNDEIFPVEFRQEIKSLKSPPTGEKYLQICDDVKTYLNKSDKYSNFPELSHGAYISKLIGSEGVNPGEGIGDDDVKTTHYWLYAPGHGAEMWDEFYGKGIMAIGWSNLGNLNDYTNKKEIQLKLQEINDDNSKFFNDVHALWQFTNEINIGDVIFVKKGMGEIIGRGIVESDYQYDESLGYYPNFRKVKWTHKGNWPYEKGKLAMKTLTDYTNYKEIINYIQELIGDEDEPVVVFPEYSAEKFLEEVYIGNDEYTILVDLLANKKNIIVQGAPGVGKTFMAKRLAYSIMGEKNQDRVMMVQFHQSYSYEDFVMGYRPSKEGFELREGAFYKFCKEAENDLENDYFFIIDEINRGNLSKIFGELFMLIENDKRGEKNKIQLLYADESFFIPKNVHIIGLMNTADRSLALIDYALRRRFAFFDLKPGFNSEGFKTYQGELDNSKFNSLIEVMTELNLDIKNDESLGEGFRIGHSYLCNLKQENVDDKLTYIVEYELIPLLKEYWFDEAEKISYWSNKLRSAIND